MVNWEKGVAPACSATFTHQSKTAQYLGLIYKSTDAGVASALYVAQALLTAGRKAEAHTYYLKPQGAHVHKRGDGLPGGAPNTCPTCAFARAGLIQSYHMIFGDDIGPFPERIVTEMSVDRLIKVGTEFRAEKRR